MKAVGRFLLVLLVGVLGGLLLSFYLDGGFEDASAPAPAPVVVEPAPVVIEPAPTVPAPAPVVVEPAPVVVEPVDDAELRVVQAALVDSQKVASACIEAAVTALKRGDPQPNCQGIFEQTQALAWREYELLHGGE
jgi:hypothetical protein